MEKDIIKDKTILDTGFGYTLSMIGGKFRLPILYTLMEYGTVRFNELKKYIVNISARTLSTVLKEMEDEGLIVRKEYSSVVLKVEYSISDKAKQLYPLLDFISEWGDYMRSSGKEKRHSDDTMLESPTNAPV